MFENKTFEDLEQSKLNSIDAKFDKREGSVIYDATAPNSVETAQVYIYMDWMLQQMFGETADREYLIKIAKDTRGISPKEATYAVLKGVFDVPIPIGNRFSIDGIFYQVIRLMDEETHTYQLQCEMPGAEGNRHFGRLTPVGYVAGLTLAELTEVLIVGEEEEETEKLRQRWRDSFQSLSFAGNKAAYKENITAIQGIGGCKIYRGTNEEGTEKGGHVRCVILSGSYGVPSDTLVESVQQMIDPKQDQEGDGLAPLWHIAHILPVVGTTIDIGANITYQTGYAFEDIKSSLESAVDEYFLELNKAWETSSQLVVRIARIESAILNVKGVMDINNTKLNNLDTNITLHTDAIAIRGEISG